MKFYDFPLAFNPPKAHLALVEKGLKFETQLINILGSQGVSPAFLRVNPAGSVPVLVDGERVITESREIVEYADTQGEGGPLGGDAVDRKLVASWLDAVDAWDGNLFYAGNADAKAAGLLASLGAYKIKVAEARRAQNPDLASVYDKKIEGLKAAGAKAKDEAAVAANRTQLEALLDRAEAQLATTRFLAGDAYSIADVLFTPVLFRITSIKQEAKYIEPRAKVAEYWKAIKARPSFQKVYGVSGLTIARLVVPTLVETTWARVTGRY